jgi:hypothetical protein
MADEGRTSESQSRPPRRGPILGLLFVLAVIIAALVLTHFLRDAARLQDCVLAGRSDCSAAPGGSSAN